MIMKSQKQTLTIILTAIFILTGVRATNGTQDNFPPEQDDVLKSKSESNSTNFSKILEPVLVVSETDTGSSSKDIAATTIATTSTTTTTQNTVPSFLKADFAAGEEMFRSNSTGKSKNRTKEEAILEIRRQWLQNLRRALKINYDLYAATLVGTLPTTPSTTTTSTTPEPEPFYIEFMEPCKKAEEDRCVGYPDVKCFDRTEFRSDVSEHVFVCNCNYLHTLYVAKEPFNGTSIPIYDIECVRNVYSPCSIGTTELKCGDNMDCITDKLGITAMKFCHCQPGFAPVPNYLGIPAFCRPILWEEPEVEDVEIESTASELEQVMTVEILILVHFSVLMLRD